MYAQLIESTTTPAGIDELGRSIRRELVTALREQPGFSGVLSLLDRETGRSLLVVLWETHEEASRPLAGSVPILAASPSTVWEVCGRGER